MVALDDPFPIDNFGPRIRESILHEFGGRCPTMHEVAGVPDRHLLKLPGFGPTTLRKLRSVTRGLARSLDAVEQWSNARLLSEHDRLLKDLRDRQSEFKRQQGELRRKLDAISIELHLRGIAPRSG